MFGKSSPLILFVLVTAFTLQSRADRWDEFVHSHPQLEKFFGSPTCPATPEAVEEQEAQHLWDAGKIYQGQKRGCLAGRYFYALMMQYPIAPWWKKAWVELISSYMIAGDYVLVMNEGNQFLDENIGTPEAEEVHFMILTAVHEQGAKFGPEFNQQWTEFALGIQGKQHDINPYFVRLGYASYLKNYPEGKHVAQIKQWQADARNELCDHYMMVGRFYYEKKQYLSAILRYAVILEWGAGIRAFPEALYETVRADWDFAKALADHKQIDDDRFLELMHSADKAVLAQREQVTADTKAEALSILKMMKEKLPAGNEWTAKAQAWVDKK